MIMKVEPCLEIKIFSVFLYVIQVSQKTVFFFFFCNYYQLTLIMCIKIAAQGAPGEPGAVGPVGPSGLPVSCTFLVKLYTYY